MSDDQSLTHGPERRSPDLPGDTQPAVRDDIGTSMGRPAEEDLADPERVEPSGARGPAGAGVVGGRGKLGSYEQPADDAAQQDT